MSIRLCLLSQPNNKLISNSEQSMNATDLLPITFIVILPPNTHGKKSIKFPISRGDLEQNINTKVHTFKILLNSGASASTVCKDVLYKHNKILKDKNNNKWSTMAGTFNTIFVIKII